MMAMRRAEPVSGVPALPWALATVLGILAADTLPLNVGVWWGMAGAGVAFWALGRRWGFQSAGVGLLCAVLAGAAVLSGLRQQAEAEWYARFPPATAEWEGVVVTVPAADAAHPAWQIRLIDEGRRAPSVLLRPGSYPASEEEALALAAALETLAIGETIRIRGTLTHPRPAGNPGEFDYRDYLLRHGIIGTLYASSVERVADLDAQELRQRLTYGMLRFVERVRAQIRDAIRGTLPDQAGAVLLALVIGDREYVDDATDEAFRRAGISHLMAVSGLHVGLVSGLVVLLLRRLGVRDGWILIGVLPVLVFYVMVTGARPSSLRAAAMVIGALAALGFRRRVQPLQFWALAGTGLLWLQPAFLRDVGFQLSFAATGAILWWLHVAPVQLEAGSWRDRLLAGASISWAAQAGTLPIVAYHFHELSLAGAVVNLIAVPLAAPVLYGGVLGAVGASVGIPGVEWLLRLLGGVLNGCLGAVEWVANFEWSAWEVAAPNGWALGAWFVALIGVPLWLRHPSLRLRRLGYRCVTGAVALHLVGATLALAPLAAGTVEVVFLDVGQGDAILIRTPRGVTALIDGGGSPRDPEAPDDYFDVGMRRVLPYLKHRGIRHIDVLINSHPHEDHLQGLLAILRQRSVGRVIDAGDTFPSITVSEYHEEIGARAIPYTVAQRFDQIVLEPGIILEVLHPYSEWKGSINDRSLVVRLVTPHGSVLLTGDLERTGQQELLWGGANLDLRAQVIKVPHHGSGRDLELRWIDAVAPELAVIQVGQNAYGHPAARVIEAYEARGATVLRTDEQGAITVTLSTGGMRVASFR